MTSERVTSGDRARCALASRVALALTVLAAMAMTVGCDVGGGEPDPSAADEHERGDEPDRAGEGVDEADRPADDVAQRIRAACRDVVDRAPAMPERVKRDVIAECEEAAADDAEAARTAADAACEAFAAATAPWPLRGAVADACRRALPDPAGI